MKANSDLIADLICSQDNNPGTGKSVTEIEKETKISRGSADITSMLFSIFKKHFSVDAKISTDLVVTK